MEMVAEGVIEPSKNLGCVTVNPTFTAIVEGKNTKEVSRTYFDNDVIYEYDDCLIKDDHHYHAIIYGMHR